MRRALPLTVLLGLAACVPRAEPVVPAPARPAPVVALPPPVPLAGDWRDWPVTPGTWAYRRDARGSIALFGAAGADARVTLRCDQATRQLYLSRQGTGTAPLLIRTTSVTRSLATQPTGGTPPYAAAALAPSDSLLDAMAFSRGHFTLEQTGAATLVVPAWPEIGRVVEDCRG